MLMALRVSVNKLQLHCSQLLHLSIRLRRSGLGIFDRDVNRFNVKSGRLFTKMMQRKFGLQFQYDPEGHYLGEDIVRNVHVYGKLWLKYSLNERGIRCDHF